MIPVTAYKIKEKPQVKRILVLLCLCALFAAYTSYFAPSHSAQKGRPKPSPTPTPETEPCPADVTNLRVTLHGNPNKADDPEKGNRLYSDRFNTDGSPVPYQTQKMKGDTIEAMLQRANCSQDFTLNLHYSKRKMGVNIEGYPTLTSSPFFNFDRVASVPFTPVNAASCDPNIPGSCVATEWARDSTFCKTDPEPAPDGGFNVGTFVENGVLYYKDNYAGCAVDEQGRAFVRRNVGIPLDNNYRIRFQYSPVDGSSGVLSVNTSYIRVYHYATDNGQPEKWELTPDNLVHWNEGGVWPKNSTAWTEGSWGALHYISNSGNAERVGERQLPFRITVERLQ